MFAIDLGNGFTLAGEVKSGILVQSQDDGDEDTSYDTWVGTWNNDAGKSLRTRLTFGYSADWGGAKIRLQSFGIGADDATNFTTKYAYGWANFLDKKIVLSGGTIGDDLWGLGKLATNVFDPSVDAVNGVRVEFKLVEGLSFGAALDVSGQKVTNSTGGTYTYRTIDHAAGSSVIGALYKSSLVSGAVGAAFKPGNATDDPYVDAIFGLQVNPVAGLTAVVDARIDTRKWETHGKIGFVRIGPRVNYATGPLTVHVLGDIKIQNEAPGENGTVTDRDGKGKRRVAAGDYAEITKVNLTDIITGAKNASGSADYAIAKYTGDPTVGARIGVDYKVSDTIGAYFQIGSDNVLWFAGDDEYNPLGAGLYLKPGVKFTFGTSSIEIFEKINRLGAKTVERGTGKDDWSPVINQFQIDFNWSF